MKIIQLIIIAICLQSVSFTATSQDTDLPRSEDVTLTKSNPYPVIDAPSKMYFSDHEGGIIAIKVLGRGNTEFRFQKFSGDKLNQQSTKTEIITVKGFKYEYIAEIKNKLYLFYSVYDKPSTSEQLFVRAINMENGGFEGKDQLLVKTNRKVTGYGSKFNLDVSSNEDAFVIKYRYAPETRDDSKNKDVLGMYVFDNDLELIWKNDFTMPYTESRMDNLDFTIGSDGTGYFLVKKYKEEVSRANRENADNQSFAILKTTGDGTLNEIEFDLGSNNLIDDVILTENANKDILCSGYYRKPKSYAPDGAFTTVLSKNGNLGETHLYEFPLELIKKYKAISERSEKKMEKKDEEGGLGMSNLYMRSFKELADGSIVLAGEIFYITTYTDSKGNTHTTYHYNDVIVTKINPDGELGWMEKLPKRSTFESFKLMTSDNYTYILFSDNPKNFSIAEDQNPHACLAKERQVIAYRLNNSDGAKSYLPLFGFREIDGTPVYQYSLNRVVGLTENSFAVEMYIKSKSDMMFKVSFDE